jgi:hypothetical protein
MSNPITVKIPPDIYAEANRYAVDVAEGDTKAWFDVRDAVANAIFAERERCEYQVCFPADWHIQDDQSVQALLEDIRARIDGGTSP